MQCMKTEAFMGQAWYDIGVSIICHLLLLKRNISIITAIKLKQTAQNVSAIHRLSHLCGRHLILCARWLLHSTEEVIWAGCHLAPFPGSSAWAEKEPGTHCLRMLSSPRTFGNLEISVNQVRYTKLRKGMRTTPVWKMPACHWPPSVWTWRRSDEGTQLFVCRNCSRVRTVYSSQTLQHVTDAISSFEIRFQSTS